MPKRLLCLGLLLLAAVLAGCLPRTYKSWNFLVYMNGDNNLEYFAVKDFEEMERIGSTKHVNIFVLFDRSPKSETDYPYTYDSTHGDWSDTRLYRVLRGNDPSEFRSKRLTPGWLTGHTELDMSDPATLRQFLVFCQKNYPAEHTVLTLWDHGSAVWPRAVEGIDGKTPSAAKAICWDDTSDTPTPWNCLTTDEIARALADAKSETGQKVDIINMDACLMQMLEVAYELWNGGDPLADYVVGSEADVDGNGNDYRAVLARLTANPAVTTREFAARLVDEYYYAYYDFAGPGTTYSALSLGSEFDLLVAAFENFAAALYDTDAMAEIVSAWNITTSFTGTKEAIDLYDFAKRLQSCQDEDVVAAASGLLQAFDQASGSAIIRHRETGWYVNRAHGISILLPDDNIWPKYVADPDDPPDRVRYAGLALSNDTDWNEFIEAFVAYTATL